MEYCQPKFGFGGKKPTNKKPTKQKQIEKFSPNFSSISSSVFNQFHQFLNNPIRLILGTSMA